MAPPVGYYNPSVPAVLPGPVTFGKAVSKENINDVPPPGHYELDPPIIRVKRSASLGRKSTSRTANQTVFERHSSCSSLISESQATPAGVQPKKLEFRPPLGSKLPVMKRNFRSSTTVNSQVNFAIVIEELLSGAVVFRRNRQLRKNWIR